MGSSQHPYFRYFSFCKASHPFTIASDYLSVINSNSLSLGQFLPLYFQWQSSCCPLGCSRHQEVCTENTGEGSHSSFLWHSSQEEHFQIDTSSALVEFKVLPVRLWMTSRNLFEVEGYSVAPCV